MRFYFRRALEACADAPGPGASRRDDGLGVGASHTDAHNDAPGPGASRRDDGLGVGAFTSTHSRTCISKHVYVTETCTCLCTHTHMHI